MAAFVPGALQTRWTPQTSGHGLPTRQGVCDLSPRMTANFPNDTGPSYDKFLSKIPMDRLNKAPMISITNIPGDSDAYNGISVQLADMRADEGAGESLRGGVDIDESLMGSAPDPSKYSKYYPVETLHEAPLISLTDGGTDLKRSLSIIQCETPTSIENAKVVLGDVDPDPMLFSAYTSKGQLNAAPFVQATYVSSDDDSAVSSDYATIPLDYAGAELIFKKYRK